MKKLLIAIALTVSATVGLSGCSIFLPQPTPAETEVTVPPVVDFDDENWDRDVTTEEFADAFPEFDVTDLVAIPDVTVQNNTRLWVLGSSDDDHAYEKAVGWAEDYVELEAEEGNDTVSGVYVGEDRNISIAIRQIGDDEDTAAFLIYITSSI